MRIESILKVKFISLVMALISCLLVGVFLYFDCNFMVGLLITILVLSIISTLSFHVLEEFYISKH